MTGNGVDGRERKRGGGRRKVREGGRGERRQDTTGEYGFPQRPVGEAGGGVLW